MKEILSGVKPSELFKEMIRAGPGVKNHDIAMAFRDASLM
ncbi:hypothetical protein IGB42_02858 [Andreprevotia sp. IGB-42]|nr:hypothetical protein IGB42_02858 [Andreprevotia sp. IGB-42]